MINLKDTNDVQIWCDYQEETRQTSADFFLRLRFSNFRTFIVSNWGDDDEHGWGDGNGDGDGEGAWDGNGYGDGRNNRPNKGNGFGYGFGTEDGDGWDDIYYHNGDGWSS